VKAQERVARAVEERGYRDGWTREQFAARQVAKLCEELGELCIHVAQEVGGWIRYSKPWEMSLRNAAKRARQEFDGGHWELATVIDEDAAREELADLQVVVFALADALDFDVVQAAVDKAEADVDRGVRAEKEVDDD